MGNSDEEEKKGIIGTSRKSLTSSVQVPQRRVMAQESIDRVSDKQSSVAVSQDMNFGREVVSSKRLASRPIVSNSRMSVMPLSVLLPSLGELTLLQKFAAGFEQRRIALRETRGSTESLAKDHGGEESMLQQILQWLAVGESELK